ncbi:MAG: hypothetical protein IKJ24_07320 [Clostridia bacterium]|nr:hypothetical protein [Clostridia bacterium]
MVESKVFVKILDNCCGLFDVVVVLPAGSEKRYESVFCSRREAVELAERINRLGVSELHILDVIEDALP